MKKVQFIKSWLVILLLFLSYHSEAANRYWYGANNSVFSNVLNWSSSPSTFLSTTVPGPSDIAFFGSYGNVNCNLTTGIDVLGIQLSTGFTATVNANTSSLTHSIGSSGLIINAGTFTVTAGSSISNTGIFTLTAGTFSVNYSSTVTLTYVITGNFNQTGGTFSCTSFAGSTINITVKGDMISSAGTFTAGNSTFILRQVGSATLTGSPAFNNLAFNPTSAVTWAIGSSPTVNALLQYAGSVTITLNSGTLNAKGDITIANTLPSGGGGSANLNIIGSGTQTLTGNASSGNGRLPNVTIACSTLHIAGTPSVAGNWVYTSGTVDANFSSSNSTVSMCGTGDIDGQGTSSTMAFQNLTIFASGTTPTRKLAGNLIVNKDLTINSGITFATGIASTSAYNTNVGGTWSDAGTFTQISSPSCTVTFDGANYGAASKTSATESFTNLTVNKTSNGMVLLGPVNVSGTLTLTAGKVKTTSTNILGLTAGATVSGGSNTAFINGPMIKTGNTSFVFPLGDSTCSTPYHPLGITAPASATDAYIAQYKATGQTSGSALASTLASVGNCEYWTLQRSNPSSGTTTLTPTLNWNSVCPNVNYSEMTIAYWNGTQWTDEGAGTLNATFPQGSLAASTSISFVNNTTVFPLVLAKKIVVQSYARLLQEPNGGYYNTNGNVLYFRYEEEYKDANGFISYQVIDPATNSTVSLMSNPTTTNVPVVYGTNDYKMDLYTAGNVPLASGKYILLVTNDKNETFQLMFNKN